MFEVRVVTYSGIIEPGYLDSGPCVIKVYGLANEPESEFYRKLGEGFIRESVKIVQVNTLEISKDDLFMALANCSSTDGLSDVVHS